MLISVVIPLFNKEEHILRAINSVLNQTHQDFELIIVDDGSTDRGEDVVRAVFDPRVRFFTQSNGGVSRARNAGVKLANAEWVAFLDADDEYEPDCLEHIVNFIARYSRCGLSMVGTNYYRGERSCATEPVPDESGIYDYFELFVNQRSPNSSSTTAVNKKKFLEVNGFPEGVKQFEDWIAWIKLAFAGSFGYIDRPLAVYHCVEGSASRSKRAATEFFNDAVLVPKTIAEYIEKYPLPPASEKNAWDCANEFTVNIAGLLAHDGAKKLAFKMLKLFRVRHLTIKRIGRLNYLLRHLMVPQSIKRIYWHYRNLAENN